MLIKPWAACLICGAKASGKFAKTCGDSACRQALGQNSRHWNPEELREKVRHLWEVEGKKGVEIAALVGRSKNVIAGLCRRMKLTKRETGRWPRDYKPKEERPAAPAKPRPAARVKPVQRATAHVNQTIPTRIAAAKIKIVSPVRVVTTPGTGCQFPISENPWRICDQPRVPNEHRPGMSPYCLAHRTLCTISPPKRMLQAEAVAA
jgi:hypothetical protein